MTKKRNQKPKPSGGVPKRPRNPFAGRPKGGAGFHSETKYGKKDRRKKKRELEEEEKTTEEE